MQKSRIYAHTELSELGRASSVTKVVIIKAIHEFVGIKHLCKRVYKLTAIKSVCGNSSHGGKSVIPCAEGED